MLEKVLPCLSIKWCRGGGVQITLPLSFHSYLDAGFTSSWAGGGIQTAPTLMKENSRSMWYECITQL